MLDISGAALEAAKERLGPASARVQWLVGDVTEFDFPKQAFDFWHDRAVFHFLREPAERARYVDHVRRALKPGGHVMIATFGPQGPERCSGLEVMRYSVEQLQSELGKDFALVDSATEVHRTPGDSEQQFTYGYFRR